MQIFFRTFSQSRPMLSLLPLLFFILLAPHFLQAQESRIPSELQQWIPWVLYEQEEVLCTLRAGSAKTRYCSWPSSLELRVDESGGTFSQKWLVETRSRVSLPGNGPLWPSQVTVDKKPILLSRIKGKPAVWIDPGTHTIRGEFSWATLPENIFIPADTGLVQLTLLGEKVREPQLDSTGKLWLKNREKVPEQSEESVSVKVFRKILDGIPLRQQLLIQLTVSGTPRQIHLGLKGDPSFSPLAIKSPLPVRLDKEGRLTLQVRPGQWTIWMTLRNTRPHSPKQMTMGDIDGLWPSSEIWVFEENPKLRQVTIGNVAAIDPSRTSLPADWQRFPAYEIKSGEQMTLTEKNRGNPSPVPNRLILKRKIWLDEGGGGLTMKDVISGTMTRGWRLNTDPSQLLGKVDVSGKPRLITTLKGSTATGVELRQGNLSLEAESRIQLPVKNGQLHIPALGWDHDVQDLSIELNLPPGWSLLMASGVDRVSTWITRWTLLDIFLVMIIALATSRILGVGWGSLALLFLIISYHQPGSPKYLWLPLLALLAIQKLIVADTGRRLCKGGVLFILCVITITSIPYMIREVRVAIYPQLEYGNSRRIINQYRSSPAALAETMLMDKEMPDSFSSVQKTSRGKSVPSRMYAQAPAEQRALQVDPKDLIQTGPGRPDWEWKKIALRWNGPVTPDQEISLFLLSPLHSTIIGFLRVLLLAIFLGGFVRYMLCHPSLKKITKQKPQPSPTQGERPRPRTTAALVLLLSLSCIAGPTITPALAEVPPPEILQELQDRLLAPPKCGTDCVVINSCAITVNKDILEIKLQVDSLTRSAVPLPGKSRFFDQIILNNKEASILRLDAKQFSLIRVEQGRHTILLKKDISGLSNLSFAFPLRPQRGQALLHSWNISGLHDDGRLDKQINIKRIAPTPGTVTPVSGVGNRIEIPAFVRVERTLHMGLEWTVTTRIIRRSFGAVIALSIPLIPGEQVTTAGLQLKNHQVTVTMGPKQNVFHFQSSLQAVNSIQLKAPLTASWTEVWFLDVSPIWHVTSKGLPKINTTNPAGKRFPEYHPYPGETLQLNISRPSGVEGPTMTVTRSKRIIQPGKRATETSLLLSLTASRGLQHVITLPPDIDIQKTRIDGREVPLQLANNRLTLPLRPGSQDIEIAWRSKHGISNKLITEPVDIGVPSVNASIEIRVPSSRWILLTGGPRIGPAVLFWGELLVLLLIAVLLGRIKLTPLGTIQWLLLSIGLSQIPIPVAALVIAWLLLLGLRKQRGQEVTTATSFNFMQISLILLTLLAMGALFFAIQQGLLGHPDMQIGGNGSNGYILRWYQDRTDARLPVAWLITVPLLAYRITMLLWALWLAVALLGWIRWGWQCFSDVTVWKKAAPRPQKKKLVTKKRVVRPSAKAVRKAPTGQPLPQKRVAPSSDSRTTAPRPKAPQKPVKK
jgi:hypothetical protein